MIDTTIHPAPGLGHRGHAALAAYLAPALAPVPAQRPRSAQAVPQVLHVDTDLDTAMMVATLLVPETQVTHAHSLQAALRALGQRDYSLIVLDPELADGDGGAIFEALRLAGSATPVLLYAERHTLWCDQASAVLCKPWSSPRQLWDAVARLLRPVPAAGRRP